METLSLESLRTLLQAGYDSWPVVTCALTLAVLLSVFDRLEPYVSGLILPISFLFLRKVALYVPVSGTLSTEDQVIFWSTGAWLYFVLFFLVYAGILWVVRALYLGGNTRKFFEEDGGILFFIGFLLLFSSVIALPVDGASHLVTPFLSFIGATKLLFIHPLLLPLVGLALAVHLVFAVFGQSRAAQEINKLLLTALVVGGIAQFCLQPGYFREVRAAVKVAESSPYETTMPGAKEVEETSNFLGDWMGKLEPITRCKVNLVEKSAEDLYQDCKIQETVRNLPAPWKTWAPGLSLPRAAVFSGLTLGLMALAGLLNRSREAAAGETAPPVEVYHQPVGNWLDIAPRASWQTLPVNNWHYGAAALTAICLAAGIFFKSALTTGFGIAGLSFVWVIAEYKLLFDVFFRNTLDTWARAFCIRDRKGQRVISPLTFKALSGVVNVEKVLNSQPDQFLLAMAASGSAGTFERTLLSCLRPGGSEQTSINLKLPAHPACTTLTRVAFAVNSQNWPGAVEAVPPSLWPSAIETLVRSKSVGAGVAATKCHAISRDTLIRFCCKHPEADVWQAAMQRLGQGEGVRPDEAIRLSGSKHAQIREAVIEKLPRDLVLELYYGDSSEDVRKKARCRLEDGPALSKREGKKLSRSPFGEVRLDAVRSCVPSTLRLKRLRMRDPFSDVRRHAFELTQGEVSWLAARRMIRSSYSDVRLRIVQSCRLSTAKLKEIYEEDLDGAVRQAAWGLLYRDIPVDEANAILTSDDITLRPRAVQSAHLPRPELLDFCGGDWQTAVREAAWEKLRPAVTAEEAEFLGRSAYGEVRLWAAQSRLLPRGALVEMCGGDTYRPVRGEAWEILRDGLTREEAAALSLSSDSEMRLSAINSGLLPPERLREMSQDWIVSVREEARRQLEDGAFSPAGPP
jgi:hypothetical protein